MAGYMCNLHHAISWLHITSMRCGNMAKKKYIVKANDPFSKIFPNYRKRVNLGTKLYRVMHC